MFTGLSYIEINISCPIRVRVCKRVLTSASNTLRRAKGRLFAIERSEFEGLGESLLVGARGL
jgi:hypothetical protein